MSFMQPRTAAVSRLGEDQVLWLQPGEHGGRQSLAGKLSLDEAGDQRARRTQTRRAHISLEGREKRGRVGQQQALATIEPQQIRVPVLRVRRWRRLRSERRPDDGEKLARAPQNHHAIVRRTPPKPARLTHP